MHYVQVEGDGYEITVINGHETVETDRPGLVLVEEGVWHVGDGDIVLSPGMGVETFGPVWIHGAGVVAIVEETNVIADRSRAPELRDVVRTDKPWGHEDEVTTVAQRVQLKRLHVGQGHRTSLQYHERKHEIMVHLDGRVEEIPPGKVHRVGDDERAYDYFEGSTFHPQDVVRLEDAYGRT